MAKMIGQTKSWAWWLAGMLCALVFGESAWAADFAPKPKYGVVPRPPVDNPAVTPEQKQAAEKLIADYLGSVAAAEPNADQKAAVEKLIKDFASSDFKVREDASLAIVKQGPAALGQLREAAKSKDAEVSSRAGTAVVAIEAAARQTIVEELKKVKDAATTVLSQQMNDARAAQAKAAEAAAAAEKSGNADELAKARAEVTKAGERNTALATLFRQLVPMRKIGGGVEALYGVTPPVQELQ